MGEVNTGDGGGKKKGGKPKGKKMSTHIDMTPMVDLAFLLLTFFMLTTSFSKPQTMEIVMPEKPTDEADRPELAKENAMTLLMGENDKLLYYMGLGANPQLEESDYSPDGIRKVLFQKKNNPDLVVLIKPSAKANYKNVVDIFDEMNITGMKKYVIVDITPAEEKMLETGTTEK
jgi:biopolymer transport protein ExbD